MKLLPAEVASILAAKGHRPQVVPTLTKFLILLVAMIVVFAVLFKVLMTAEDREYSWVAAIYWVLTVMSTLGFGDITFESALGQIFSIVVLLSGMVFLLILLPFLFIEFFYEPFMRSQLEASTPRKLPEGTKDHILLTHFDDVSASFARRLEAHGYSYALVQAEIDDAAKLSDHGFNVVVGPLDVPDTFTALYASDAALVALTGPDTSNAHVATTLRASCHDVRVAALAHDDASIDVLELAGCDDVFHLPSKMATALVRRICGGDSRTHSIGEIEELVVAEANVRGTSLVGKTLATSNLRARTGAGAIGVWGRGRFEPALPSTAIDDRTVLLLAGTRAQLNAYDECFGQAEETPERVVVLGGGRVGREVARQLEEQQIEYCVVERNKELAARSRKVVVGNAADLEILKRAGIDEATSVLITPHDDDTNIYLTIYCRKLRPDVQIIARSSRDRSLESLHRAGADFVLSYATMGANLLLNALEGGKAVMVDQGLFLFRVRLPQSLVGRSLVESSIREKTGATVVGVEDENGVVVNPDPREPLAQGGRLLLIGDNDAEYQFQEAFGAG